MKIAYIASSEFSCPPPPSTIQAALTVASYVIDGMTQQGYETIYIGAGNSTVNAKHIISMGKAFFDIYKYEEWVKLSIPEKDQTLSTFQNKLNLFLLDFLKNNLIDIIHFHTSPPIFSLPFIQYINIPKVQTLHDPIQASYIPLFKEYQTVIKNHHFISISNAQQDGLKDLFEMSTVYNGVPIEKYSLNINPTKELLFLGRIKRIKGIKETVQVALDTKKSLSIAGRFADSEKIFIDKEIIPFIDNKQIQYVGLLGHDEKVEYLRDAKILMLPVLWEEPFGLVMIEAMACGTPVIAYARGSVPEIVKDGQTGFIVNSSDSDSRGDWVIKKTGIAGLTEAVKRIYAMGQEQYQNMRKACRKLVEEKFTVEKMVEGYEKVYKKVLSK